MTTDYVASREVEVLCENRTTEFLEVSEMVCQVHWQYASPYQKKRYPFYALTPFEYAQTVEEWNERDEGDDLIPWLAAVIKQVTNHTWSPIESRENRWKAGRVLKITSFTRFLFGASVCRGDMEWYLSYLDSLWREGDVFRPCNELYSDYARGNRAPLLTYLNKLLEAGTSLFVEAAESWGTSPLSLLPFVPGSPRGTHQINFGYINSEYPALLNLLEFLEGEGGTA